MLTIEQCRAARGLLGWTQQDLADACGLSKTAINNFEKEHSDIKTESLRAIRMAFESADIEFIGLEGVSRKTENFKILRGSKPLNKLIDDIHRTLAEHKDDEILISFVTQELANRLTTDKLFEHIEFLKNNSIKQRVLCAEGEKHILSPTDECRWIDKKALTMGTTHFIYGHKVAFELWDRSMIIVTTSKEASTIKRQRFETLWADAQIATDNSNEEQENISALSS